MQGPPYDPRFQPPPAGSYGVPARREPPASNEAVAAIVLAAASWMCFPLGYVAIFLGLRARQLASQNPETVGGDQLGLIAMIVGGVLAGLQTLLWLGYAAMIAYFALVHKP
ncbi:MAG TPA: hypothetical protein VM686_10375 [Polyangiaceae bacterium]|nr:hypothetical protein [Polyangiaceae bacterium]